MRKAIVVVLGLALIGLLGQATLAQDLNLTAGVDYLWGQGALVDDSGVTQLTGDYHVPILNASAELTKTLGIEFTYASGNFQNLTDGGETVPPETLRFVVTLIEVGGTYKLSKPGAKLGSSIGAGYMKVALDPKGQVVGPASEDLIIDGFYLGGKVATTISKDLSGKLVVKYSPFANGKSNNTASPATMLSWVIGGDYKLNDRANLEFGYRKFTVKDAESSASDSFGGLYVGGAYRF